MPISPYLQLVGQYPHGHLIECMVVQGEAVQLRIVQQDRRNRVDVIGCHRG